MSKREGKLPKFIHLVVWTLKLFPEHHSVVDHTRMLIILTGSKKFHSKFLEQTNQPKLYSICTVNNGMFSQVLVILFKELPMWPLPMMSWITLYLPPPPLPPDMGPWYLPTPRLGLGTWIPIPSHWHLVFITGDLAPTPLLLLSDGHPCCYCWLVRVSLFIELGCP